MAQHRFGPALNAVTESTRQREAPRPLGASGLEQGIRPEHPFVFEFAAPDTTMSKARITPGVVASVQVAGPTRGGWDADDWFAARTPAIRPVTGPIFVAGVAPGDILEIELLFLEPRAQPASAPFLATITVASGRTGGDALQVAIPAGGLVRIPAQRPGGLISIGPVHSGQQLDRERACMPVPACLSIRVTIVQPIGAWRAR